MTAMCLQMQMQPEPPCPRTGLPVSECECFEHFTCTCGDFSTCEEHQIAPRSAWNPPIRCERCRELTPARMMAPEGLCWDCMDEVRDA